MRHVDRRTFLSGAALIGAGFALPGCTSLPPRGAPDVVVLGAGMAGLTAAHSLHRAGLDVIVLEARERVGGRIHTLADPAPHGVEIGAQMIHGSRAPTWQLIREFGSQIAGSSFFCQPVPSQPMAVYSEAAGLPGRKSLGQEAANYTCQDITHAAGCHARVSRRINGRITSGGTHQGIGSF